MSATSGRGTARLTAGISPTDSSSGTAARRMSHPAAASAFACRTQAEKSRDGAFSIDCTVTFAPPPTAVFPTMTFREALLILRAPFP